jgi:hypothetical protein
MFTPKYENIAFGTQDVTFDDEGTSFCIIKSKGVT